MKQNSLLDYCGGGEEVFTRLRCLYKKRDTSIICARTDTPSKTLKEFAERHTSGFCDYPDPVERAIFWDRYLSERKDICDDSVPSAYLSEMDQGLYGGIIGGETRFLVHPENGWISSMTAPIIKSWSEFKKLSFNNDSLWFKRYLNQLEIFKKYAHGKFGISHFILINGLNFVFELFGATRTYLEAIENPEKVEKACEFGLRINLKVQDTFFEKIGLIEGGTCSNMVQWIDGKIISESVDPFHMASIDFFERWGKKQLEDAFSHFDGGVIHIHGNGRHLLPVISKIEKLRAIYLGDDNNYPQAFSILKDIKKIVGDIPLVVDVSYNDFISCFEAHRLTGGVFYRIYDVPDKDTANFLMDKIREYRV